VEGADGARIGGVLSSDLILVFFTFAGLAGLTFRFDRREEAAL
jgi:hypothetical protein